MGRGRKPQLKKPLHLKIYKGRDYLKQITFTDDENGLRNGIRELHELLKPRHPEGKRP